MMNASIPDISHLCSTSVLGILSCHVILASYATQTTHVELIKTAYVTSIGDPRLAAVQQGGDDYSFVDCNLCAQAYTTFLPEAGFQSAECCASSTFSNLFKYRGNNRNRSALCSYPMQAG